MASSKLCAELNGRVMPVLAASNTDVLPLDAMYEILLRLPAKTLCRLRTVCRFWRYLLSDPLFAAAHAALHPEPHIIVGYNCSFFESEDGGDVKTKIGCFVDIMDLSGRIVKHVPMDGHDVMSMPLNLVCVRKIANNSCRLVSPADAAMYYVRENLAEDPPVGYDNGMYLFGQVASTGEYKAFRKVKSSHVGVRYEVCTLSSSSHARWRVVQGPPNTFGWGRTTSVVIDGVVYFLVEDVYFAVRARKIPVIERDWILSFDLETEKWRPNIRGPQSIFLDNAVDLRHLNVPSQKHLSLVNLNGSLVILHGSTPCMNLWFLMDFEKGLWVKQYSIQIERWFSYVWPLLVLDDGRIVIVIHTGGLQMLEIHDPRTNNFSYVAETSYCHAISVYTGNLLSLEWWQPTNNEKEVNEKVMQDGDERTWKVSKDAFDLRHRWATGLRQIKSLCGLADAFLSVMFGEPGFS